jgi:hypothetical protein
MLNINNLTITKRYEWWLRKSPAEEQGLVASIVDKMPISKNNLQKLGLAANLQVSNETQFIDSDKITHKKLQNVTIDVINNGTLRYPEPMLVVKQLIDSDNSSNNYQLHYIPAKNAGYYSEINFNYPLIGQLSYFAVNERMYNVEDNSSFSTILNGTKLNESFYHQQKIHCQFVFDSPVSNSKSLTGIYTNATGKISPFINTKTNAFTGRLYTNSFNYKIWTSGNTSGISNLNYNGYYLPYPLTIYYSNYNAYNIPLKIATSYFDTIGINSGEKVLNGIIAISTGNGTNSKICYLSNHGLNTGYRDTFVFGQGSTVNTFTNITGYKKINSGISIKTLSIGSEYYSGNIFSGTGITYSSNSGFFDSKVNNYYISGISGSVNPYTISANQHLKQDIPIKDTLYYKFYNNIYTGSKTFNTGTWDGIIPTGTIVQIELISTEINKTLGTKYPLYFIYTGYGSNDLIDAKCTKYLNSVSSTGETFLDTKFLINNNNFEIKGRGYGMNEQEAWTNAQKNIKYNINNKVSKILKTYTPEFIKSNSKYKKFQKFLNKYRS